MHFLGLDIQQCKKKNTLQKFTAWLNDKIKVFMFVWTVAKKL